MKRKKKAPAKAPTVPEEVEIRCAFTKLVPVEDLKPHPRNPNRHPESQIALLAKVIRHQGWRAPLVVSKRSGFIVAGNGRFEAAKALRLAKVPVDFQDFATDADELAHLVADNRIPELAEISEPDLKAILDELKAGGAFDLELTGFDMAALRELKAEEVYSRKILSPVYSPKGEKPSPKELFDRTKTAGLIAAIEKAKLPKDVADFLKLAAERHTVFNFRKIAEFFCHADAKVQRLMEQSGLVIVDFDKAIEHGFVHMTDLLGAIADLTKEDSESA